MGSFLCGSHVNIVLLLLECLLLLLLLLLSSLCKHVPVAASVMRTVPFAKPWIARGTGLLCHWRKEIGSPSAVAGDVAFVVVADEDPEVDVVVPPEG